MQTVSLSVSKAEVFKEVAKTTAYEGVKNADENAYDRIAVTDANSEILGRFFDEAASVSTAAFKRFVSSVTMGDTYSITLSMSSLYDTAFNGVLQKCLFSFFVDVVVAKWLAIADKDNAKTYEDGASDLLVDMRSMLFHKKAPAKK